MQAQLEHVEKDRDRLREELQDMQKNENEALAKARQQAMQEALRQRNMNAEEVTV